jgi:UDP-N-acetylmuramate--alanine ligase
MLTYGSADDCDLQAVNIVQNGMQTRFQVRLPNQAEPWPLTLNLPGRHSVLNALAAIAVALELGVPMSAIQTALENFQGIGRRFQRRGELTIPGGGSVTLIDDYGHHPREVEAVLQAIRAGWPDRRLVLVFQPHRYSRTRDLLDDFAQVLSNVDLLLLTEVYPAGEKPIPGADGRALSRAVRVRSLIDPVFVEQVTELPRVLPSVLADGDLLLLMGAGNIGAVAAQLGRDGLGTVA